MKKIIVVLLSILSLTSIALADDSNIMESNNITSLRVMTIETNKNSYNAGETITGSFVLKNYSSTALTDLSFQLLIGADYDEVAQNLKFAGKILDFGPRQGNISISKDGSVVIPFNYTIPSFVGGNNVAMLINIFTKSGQLITWGNSDYFNIKNNISSISLGDFANIVLSNGEVFELGEGPTIYKDKDPKEASVSFSVSNLNEIPVSIVPNINVYKQGEINNSEKSILEVIVLKGNETKEVSIPLPTLSYEPGIYLADIILKNTAGEQLSSLIEARYIIGGNIATVQSIYTDKEVLSKGESFSLETLITGLAPDMTEFRNGVIPVDSGRQGLVEIKFYNERDVLVSSVKDIFNIVGNTNLSKELEASARATALRVEVLVYDDLNQVILDYKKNISADYDIKKSESKKGYLSLFDSPLSSTLTLIVSAIVLLLIIYFMKKRNVLGGTAILVFLFTCFAMFPSTAFGSGYQITVSPSLTYPADGTDFFDPGETIYAYGSTWFTACNNVVSNVNVSITSSWGQTVNLGWVARGGGLNRGAYGYYGHYKSFGPATFKAPTTPGRHYLTYTAVIDNAGTTAIAYAYITVKSPPTVTVDGVCGSANGVVKSTAPTSNLCSSGTASDVTTQNNKWSWTCTGTNTDGADNVKSCLAPKSGGGCGSGQYECNGVCIPNGQSCGGGGGGGGATISCTAPTVACGGTCCNGICCAGGVCSTTGTCELSINRDSEDDVVLKDLIPSPILGNSGYNCIINWSDKFTSYNNYTRCTFSTPSSSINFSPASLDPAPPTSYTVSDVHSDTLVRMTCEQVVVGTDLVESSVPGTTKTEEAVCRVNWSAVEVN